MTIRSRISKLEGRLSVESSSQLVSNEWFDAVVARVLQASELGRNLGIGEISRLEAMIWAKDHCTGNVSFGGFEFDVDEVISKARLDVER